MISTNKLSTPDYIEAQTRAVSSTPNQDASRLKRNGMYLISLHFLWLVTLVYNI